MKKILTFSLFFVYFLYFSQNYYFDNKCEILETKLKGNYRNLPERKILYFFNSKDSTYISYNFRPNEIHLFDYNTNMLKLLQIRNNSKTIFFDLLREDDFRNFRDEIIIKNVIVNDLGDDLYLIKAFSKENSKKPNLEIKIKLKTSDNSLVRIHFMDLTENIHDLIYDKLLEQLPSKKYQIENIYLDYRNGIVNEIKMNKCEKINLKYSLNFSPKK